MGEKFQSRWMGDVSGRPRYGTDKSDKRGSNGTSVTSGTPLVSPSRNHNDIDIDDPTTWPDYLARLHDEALAEGGEKLARRQLRAEVAFWNGATAAGWVPWTHIADTEREPS